MTSPSSNPRGAGAAAVPKRRLRIALRLWDWSEWGRQIIRGVQSYAHAKPDWQLYIATGAAGTANIYRRDQHWSGIMAALFDDTASIRRLIQAGHTQIVAFTTSPPVALKHVPAVRVNETRIASAIGRHLLSGGFRRLAYLRDRPSRAQVDSRAAALAAFAAAEGLPFEIYQQGFGAASSMRSLTRWIARLEKPVGIAVWNMPMARLFLQACQRARVAVPEQVAVVAWDDDALVAESAEPTITGAVLPVERLGYETAHLLDRLLSGKVPPDGPVLIEPSGVLHVRQSSDVSSIADREVMLALQYIREHASVSLPVSKLVGLLQVSRRKLEQDFARVTGQTINQAIVAVHLARARQLLVETAWSIERVAEQSGFGSKQHFHHVFLAQEGVTPAKYRTRFGPL